MIRHLSPFQSFRWPLVTRKTSCASACQWKPGASDSTAPLEKTAMPPFVCFDEAKILKTPLLPGMVTRSPSSWSMM